MGLVKISILGNNRAMQSDNKIFWIMFHKIYGIYRYLKHQDTLQAPLEIQSLKSHIFYLPPQKYQLS